jgi:predicted nucleic acid-binding protein
MKALIDTNVVLDALMSREPWREAAERLLLASAEGLFDGCVSASAVTDVYYIIRRRLGSNADASHAMRRLLQVVGVLDVTGHDCLAALDLDTPDFEDAVQAAAALRAGVDFIITRDRAGFPAGTPTISPADFLERI